MAFGKHPRERRSGKRASVRRRLVLERLTNRRVLAAITGVVFEDIDQSLRQEAEESVLTGRLVYLDANANAALDSGEPLAISQPDGSFEFGDLADGNYLLRLFNGAESQSQSTPVNATLDIPTVAIADGFDVIEHSVGLLSLTQDSIVIGNVADGASESIFVGDQLLRMQTLPSGEVVVIGGVIPGDTAWIVNPETQSVASLDLSGQGQTFALSDIAIDANGNGVVLHQSTNFASVIAIDATDPNTELQVSDSGTVVPSDARVLASDSGNRSVFGWEGPTGLQLSLWSNSTATWITNTPIEVPGASELLAYDDASGLLALRTDDGGVSLHDADSSFAELHSLPEVTGAISLDGEREFLVTVSDELSTLQLIDLRNAETIADLNVDLSTIGQVASLRIQSNPNAVLVQGSSGATKVSLTQPAAHPITVSGGIDPAPVLFGLTITGENATPAYLGDAPEFTIDEDQSLLTGAPGALLGTTDSDGDHFVIFLSGPATNGDATLQVNGSLNYQPSEDFNGVGTIPVVLHDGVSGSSIVPLSVTVNPVPDDPTDIEADIPPIAENILNGDVLGPIVVLDVDLNDQHEIIVNDPRFRVEGGQLIFVGEAGELDFETEPVVLVSITAIDPDTSAEVSETVSLTLIDANDPITDITPHQTGVMENVPGSDIATLVVHDDDANQTHTITVDDERFEVIVDRLKLVDGVSLDYEAEQSVTISVTATENVDGGHSFTQEITLAVGNEAEQPESISLDTAQLVELDPGAIVGSIQIDGNPITDSYIVGVDDSRFEIVDSELKLKEGEWVELAVQDEIEIIISAQDVGRAHDPFAETFVIQVVENPTPYHTDRNPYDVDDNFSVTATDALIIINYLNTFGPGPIGHGNPALGYDVNLDRTVTALDALLVLNELNRIAAQNSSGTVGGESSGNDELPEGEGEQVAPIAPGNITNEAVPSELRRSDFLGPVLSPVQQSIISSQLQDLPADIDEMKDLVLRNAELLGLDDAQIESDSLTSEQLSLNYRIMKAVLAESETTTEQATEQFAKDVDASLGSYLDDGR